METRIAKVRLIKKDKTGKTINIAIIDTMDGKTSIVRNEKQFLTDLEESGLITSDVKSINHPKVAKLRVHLVGGQIFGEVNYTKAGEKYTVTADSRVITDKNHPQYGRVSVGDVLTSEKDRAIVDGFLTMFRADKYEQMVLIADAHIDAQLAQSGIFDSFKPTISVDAEYAEVDEEDLPLELAEEIAPAVPAQGKGK